MLYRKRLQCGDLIFPYHLIRRFQDQRNVVKTAVGHDALEQIETEIAFAQ